jgi:hypothetical protein
MIRRRLTVLLLAGTLVAACSGSSTLATVDGETIDVTELAALHPAGADLDAEQRAASLFLIILHRLLVEGARQEFDLVVSESAVDAAFTDRTQGLGEDVDRALAERGVTAERVRLEAELDVIRAGVEEALVRSESPGFDFADAYRTFLSTNSNVCLVVLQLADAELSAPIRAEAEAGDDLDVIFERYPDRTARLDMGCRSPIEHGAELAPVALDGEVGRTYLRDTADEAIYLVKVVERQAPPADDVRDEVIAGAIASQGPELFDAWAVEILQSAEVTVDDGVGSWGTTPQTGDVPTVVARS